MEIEKEKISIALLELFYAILYAARIALVQREEWEFPPATKHFRLVGRSDNEAVCYLTASRLETNPLMRLCLRSLRELEREFNVPLLADHIAGVDNYVPCAMSRDEMARVARECQKEGIPMPIQLEPCAVWEGYMARAIQVLTSKEHPEGDWRVDEMMEATEEAEEEAERLETERRASEDELGNSARPNLDS